MTETVSVDTEISTNPEGETGRPSGGNAICRG